MIQTIWIWWCLINLVIITQGKECGVLYKTSDKIVGGRDVGFLKYPWYTGLFQVQRQQSIVCGGTLIAAKYVITAAHCFKPWFQAVKEGRMRFEEIYVAKLGINNVCIPEHTQQTYTTKKVYVHEKYATEMPYFDIALIELDNVASFIPCCLPKARYESNNRSQEPAVIIGLGKEASNAWKTPCNLKEAEVPIQPDEICRNMLTAMKVDGSKLQGAFCAGFLEGKIDTCQGDSGGPLQTKDADDIYTILGITSFGFGCAKENMLGIYTDVSHYLDWIYDKIGYDHRSVSSKSDTNRVQTIPISVTSNQKIDTTTTATRTIGNTGNKDATSKNGPAKQNFHKRKLRNRSFLQRLLNGF